MSGIQKISYTHDAMIDLILANPKIRNDQLAAMFDRTPAWISTIKGSDAFKERLAARRAEIIDPALTATIEERWKGLAERSLEVLQEKLSVPADQIPDNLALQAATLGAKAMGTGGFGAKAPIQVTLTETSEERLARLASRLKSLVPTGDVIDVETSEPARPDAPYPGQPGASALSNGSAQG